MSLQNDETLERSPVVANCRMNRERRLLGFNGYDRELGFDPLPFLERRASEAGSVGWLDLCCGRGLALIEAVARLRDRGPTSRFVVVGVDLAGMFAASDAKDASLRLVEASLRTWRPDRDFDLITCVHGLHYLGDKLGLIARAASWLAPTGEFAATLDLANFKLADGRSAGRRVAAAFRQAGLGYDSRRRLIRCQGKRTLEWPFRYLGADDRAGPNFTGQPAVDSYYAAVVPTADRT